MWKGSENGDDAILALRTGSTLAYLVATSITFMDYKPRIVATVFTVFIVTLFNRLASCNTVNYSTRADYCTICQAASPCDLTAASCNCESMLDRSFTFKSVGFYQI